MKKFKKLGKVRTIVAALTTFLVTYAVVYAAGSHFYQKYGTSGYLKDNKLEAWEWDKLMEDLDTYSCPTSDCPTSDCPSCDGVKAYISPDGTMLRGFTPGMPEDGSEDNYDRFLYDVSGKKLLYSVNNYAGLCPGGGQAGSWLMNDVYINNNGTKFCAYVSQCEDVRNKTYYIHVKWNWIKITFDGTCNSSQITFTTKGIHSHLDTYQISIGNGSNIFNGGKYLEIHS